MDKLKLAHDYFMKHVNTDQYRHLDDEDLISWSFDYVDAMQAEADKREDKTRPDVLKEDWQPDWSKAPENTIAWFMLRGSSSWLLNDFRIVCAPTFGFTGSHIVERPHGF